MPDASCTTTLAASRDAAWRDALGVAGAAGWNAAMTAILAPVVRDRITAEQFDSLYGPWASVMDKQ